MARLTELAEKGATVTRAVGALQRSMPCVQVKARSLGKPLRIGIRSANSISADADAVRFV
jgi:hypothetical protein